MILGIGVDIVRTARFAEILARTPHRIGRLQRRVLHPQEIAAIKGGPDGVVWKLASSWAAKEALYKSLTPAQQKQCQFNKWKRVFTARGQEMQSDLAEFADQEVLVSVSHDGDYTIAYALRQQRAV